MFINFYIEKIDNKNTNHMYSRLMNELQIDKYSANKNYLEEWLNKNIISSANQLVSILECNDFENFETEDETIYEWYIITDEAYTKFNKIGWIVAKIGELNLFGRTVYGQNILMDFYYNQSKIDIILDNS